MTTISRRLALLACLLLPAAGLAATKAEKQEDVRETTQKTLERLYKSQPKAKEAIERAAGYAVFSNFGMKLFVAGGGSGSGMAVNTKTKQETFHEDGRGAGGPRLRREEVPPRLGVRDRRQAERLSSTRAGSSAPRRRRARS
jgi:hypothetical protein